jgi:hypothetical protein
MESSAEADELIGRASRFSADELNKLIRATRNAFGSGLGAYLGKRSPMITANRAASEAIKQAEREEAVRSRVLLVEEAMLAAAIAVAGRAGRDTSGVLDAWQRYGRVVESGSRKERKRTFRATKAALRRGLGRPLAHQWHMAIMGASWAMVALTSWDLVSEKGPYTVRDREALTLPWKAVAPFPAPSP